MGLAPAERSWVFGLRGPGGGRFFETDTGGSAAEVVAVTAGGAASADGVKIPGVEAGLDALVDGAGAGVDEECAEPPVSAGGSSLPTLGRSIRGHFVASSESSGTSAISLQGIGYYQMIGAANEHT